MSGRRGQLLLIAGLGIAMTLVVLAIVLNTVIFTQNLATREAVDARGPIELVNAAEDGVGGSIAAVNFWNATDYATIDAEFREAVTSWRGNVSKLRASRGAVTTATLHDTTNGTRIVQSTSGSWTSASDDSSWTMVTGVSGVRRFHSNVSATSTALVDPSGSLPSSNAFRITVSDGSNTWTLYVYDDGDDDVVDVTARTPSGVQTTCSVTGQYVSIDLTEATVGGEACEFEFGNGTATPFDVAVENGGNVDAKYTLVVDRTRATVEGGVPSNTYHQQATGESPYLTPALYSARINMTFGRADVRYTNNFTVTPESVPGGETYQVAPSASARGLVFVNASSGELQSVDKSGTITTYDAPVFDPVVIGPKHTDLVGDDLLDVPYVTSNGNIHIIDADDTAGPAVSLTADAKTSQTAIASGLWNGNRSVFFVDASDGQIYELDPATGTTTLVGSGIQSSAVLGVSDFNDDGDTDIVYVAASDKIRYLDDGSTTEVNAQPATGSSMGVGAPRDLDRDGERRAPYVTGSDVGIIGADDPPTTFSTGNAEATNLAAFDVVGDDRLEVVYVDTSGVLRYVTLDGTTGTVPTADGAIQVDSTTGVA